MPADAPPTGRKAVIVGAGFARLNAVRLLREIRRLEVTVIDRENHHLFQPLLYRVAMAALSPQTSPCPFAAC